MESDDAPRPIPIAEEDSLYEVEDPNFEEVIGGLKTQNPSNNRWQREYVHVSPKKSRFKKTVQMILCLHGWETSAKTQPMTLLIFKVSLNCQSQDFRFQSVRMWLEFHEDTKATPPNTEEASPTVVGFAPFSETELWNETPGDIVEKKTLGGELGAEYMATLKLHADKEKELSYTRKYFDRGSADYLVDDWQRLYGVNWYMEQNKLQNYGVKPTFHLAVLLKRSHTEVDNQPISFSGHFDMKTEAGFLNDFRQGARRLFRLYQPEDEAIYFDCKTDLVSQINGEAEKIRKRIDKDNLGALLQDGLLVKLLHVDTEAGEKTLEGLEPFKPVGA